MSQTFTTIDQYIETLPDDIQKILQDLRAAIKEVLPDAEEAISYGIPTFKQGGSYIVYLSGWKHHISVYPIPSDEALRKELEPYVSGKGTLKFPLDKPVPRELVQRAAIALAHDNATRAGYSA